MENKEEKGGEEDKHQSSTSGGDGNLTVDIFKNDDFKRIKPTTLNLRFHNLNIDWTLFKKWPIKLKKLYVAHNTVLPDEKTNIIVLPPFPETIYLDTCMIFSPRFLLALLSGLPMTTTFFDRTTYMYICYKRYDKIANDNYVTHLKTLVNHPRREIRQINVWEQR